MAGKINKENFAIILAKTLLAHPDLKEWGMRYEDNPELLPVVLFVIVFPAVLQNLAKTYTEFVPIYEEFNASLNTENSYPESFLRVGDAIMDSELAMNPPINSDSRFRILMAALLANIYPDEYKSVGEKFFLQLENGDDLTGLNELVLLSTAFYKYNYEEDFCDLVAQHYYSLKAEGFGGSI